MANTLLQSCLVCVLSLSVGAGTFDVETDNVLGILKVVSPSTNTIVAVPWVAFGTNDAQSVRVADLVKTDCLTDGDWLHVPDGNGEYVSWRLSGGRWQSAATVARAGVLPGIPADEVLLPRGSAFFLIRQRPRDERGVAVPFYLYGQHTEVVVAPVFTAGSVETPVHHLLANPHGTETVLNDLDWTGAADNDTIVLPSGSAGGVQTILLHVGGKWGFWDSRSVWDPKRKKYKIEQTYVTDVTVSPGTGFWYVSRGGRPAWTWKAVTP